MIVHADTTKRTCIYAGKRQELVFTGKGAQPWT